VAAGAECESWRHDPLQQRRYSESETKDRDNRHKFGVSPVFPDNHIQPFAEYGVTDPEGQGERGDDREPASRPIAVSRKH
jgi:hypothetical protein